MEYSKRGIALTESFEECRLTAYYDVGGVLTIGWGHTGPEVIPGHSITQEEADRLLLEVDLPKYVAAVNDLVKVPLTQEEFDALVDFNYNVGIEAFTNSTMLRCLNISDYHGAAAQFENWDHVHGKVVAGLLRRRREEEVEFIGNLKAEMKMGLDLTGLGAVADAASGIINHFFPDKTKEEQGKLTLEMQGLMAASNVQLAQIGVDQAEAASPDRLQHWRGALGWVCVIAFAYHYVLFPMLKNYIQLSDMDVSTMYPLLMGMLGLGAMHVTERVKGTKQ